MRDEFQRQYGSLFEEWKIDLALSRIVEMGFPQSDWPDLMQELAVVMVDFEYEPDHADGATEKTVLYSVITLELQTLQRSHCRRLARQERYAIKAGPDDETVVPPFSSTHMPDENDIQPVLETLGEYDLAICRWLARGLNVNQVADKIDCDWHTVKKAVGRIAKHFRSHGIDGWV